jgi:predicted nucleic acid-binding protein
MSAVFADTSALLASLNDKDEHHAAAARTHFEQEGFSLVR